MKKHNFEQAVEIFKGMFEGWSLVTKDGKKHPIMGVDYERMPIGFFSIGKFYNEYQISHLEQTLPMNGDEVWAWDDDPSQKNKFIYIGKTTRRLHVCLDEMRFVNICFNVELITHKRKLSIDEATELLKSVINEPFEIEQ